MDIQFLDHAQEMQELIKHYYKTIESFNVLSKVFPNEIRGKLPLDAPEKGEDFSAIVKDIHDIILPGITHWQHPHFYAYFPSNTSFPSILGDMLSSALGVQGMMWITSPACTELETHVLDWMAKLLALPSLFLSPFSGGTRGGGVIQGSASEAVLAVLVAARWRIISSRLPHLSNLQTTHLGTSESGKDEAELDTIFNKVTVYISDQTHSVVRKGCIVAGIRQLRVIPSDKNTFAMRVDLLEEQIEKDIKGGYIPMFVCSTIGSTSTTAIDPLTLIGEVSKKYKLWLHIDAAYAGAFCVLPEFQHHLKGVEYADSFNFNAHKTMLTNFDCSLLWVQESKSLVDALTLTPEFLRNKATSESGVIDYKDWGVPLGRRFRSLKLWFVLRMYGVSGIYAHLRRLISFAEQLEELINRDSRFELITPRQFALVCFCLKSTTEDNKKLLDTLLYNRYLSHTIVNEKYLIRMALASSQCTLEHVQQAWQIIQQTTTELFPQL